MDANSSRPIVSVLLPFRDAALTLDAAVRSIVDQTMQDWELLLIDNASQDGGHIRALEWVGSDPRIKLIGAHEIGIAHALNAGLAHAHGSYIARMDADDTARPERLARQLSFLVAHPEIGVLGTRTRFRTTVERSIGMRSFVDRQNGILTPRDHYLKRFVDAPLAHPTVMFRRELIAMYGGYDTGPLPEDHELWLRWMHHGVRFAKLQEELLTWNDHDLRLSRTHPNYGVDAFFRTKAYWITLWYKRKFADPRPIIIAGTSNLCRDRARMLESHGLRIEAYTDVRRREVPGHRFIPYDELPGPGEALLISFIGQRGTGDRIAGYLTSRGLSEGDDFILAA